MGQSSMEESHNSGILEMLKLEPVYHKRIETDLGKIYRKEAVLGIKNQLLADYLKSLTKEKLSCLSLFSQTYRKRMLVGMALNALQQLSGINFLTLYSVDNFNKQLGEGDGDIINIIGANVMFWGFIPTVYFSNAKGRKFNFVLGYCFQFVGMTLLYI
jgi:ethanolamine transporter EutH